jgi:hypothetical protein
MKVDFTIVPAEGTSNISRRIVRMVYFGLEETIGQMKSDGVVVVRGDVINRGIATGE